MAKENLIYGLRGEGAFNDPNVWTPGEAPKPNNDQKLSVVGGTLVINSQPWQDYDLSVQGTSNIVFADQTLDAASNIFQSAVESTYTVTGNNGLSSYADFHIGGSGAQATAHFNTAWSPFRNYGSIDVDGNIIVNGYFINNGTVTIENGTAFFQQVAVGDSLAAFVIGENGVLEFGGYSNASVNFASEANGRLMLDSPWDASSVRTINGFDQGDTINIVGTATSFSYQGTAEGGALFLSNATGGEVARLAFNGAYDQASFSINTDGARTLITTNKTIQDIETTVPSESTPAPSGLQSKQPVLDLDFHGRRDTTDVTVNGPNDVTLKMTNLTIRGTELSRADFLDGSLVFDGTAPNGRYVPDEDASAIARMYYTVLGRAPEFAGVHYWVEDVMDGQNISIKQLAPGFYQSAEFKARYGENTSDQQFVSLLYQNVLGRAGEPGGVNYWTGLLGQGTSRADVVLSISESYEHQSIRYSAIEQGGIVFADHPFL
ncbi:DUF4214 domain-containing protein [Belnapia rosea]|uniref:DUF4214 domain-containing protein n=1 Tax=Belnapia rosea TaxID=938405 RepID=UPI0008813890|nr:DUF4214 domain-containing protein [Belnapia rosea]SDB74843.1 protein of unknown function [Belnapia rosea]